LIGQNLVGQRQRRQQLVLRGGALPGEDLLTGHRVGPGEHRLQMAHPLAADL
jgi:hypothetical protein